MRSVRALISPRGLWRLRSARAFARADQSLRFPHDTPLNSRFTIYMYGIMMTSISTDTQADRVEPKDRLYRISFYVLHCRGNTSVSNYLLNILQLCLKDLQGGTRTQISVEWQQIAAKLRLNSRTWISKRKLERNGCISILCNTDKKKNCFICFRRNCS